MLKRPVKALLLALIAVLVVATPVMAYVYRAQYAATNNSTTTYDMMPFIGHVNNEWMAANGFMNASANDTRIETLAGAYKPHMVADNKTLTAIPSPANSQTNLYYTTGNAELASFYIIPGYDGHIYTADNATIELGDNFTYQTTVWVDIDAGVGKNLVRKHEAFKIFVSENVSGNITAAILTVGGSANLTLNPDGAGSETGISDLVDTTHWGACSDNTDATHVKTLAVGYERDLFTTENHTVTQTPVINSVTFFWRQYANAGTGQGKPSMKTHGVVYDGVEQNQGAAWAEKSQVYATCPNTTAAWTWDEITALEIGVSLHHDGGNYAYASKVWIVVNYDADIAAASVTATGVSSGEHTVNVTEVPLLWAPGEALYFPGDAATGSVNCTAIYNNQAKFWMSFWFRLDGDYSSANISTMYFFGKVNTGTDKIYLWLDDTDGRLTFRYYDAAEKFKIYGQRSGADITSWEGGRWYNVFWQISDTGGVRLIVDNDTIVTNADTTPLPNGGDLFLGNIPGSVTGLQGLMSNVIVGTDNLTPSETSALYYGNLPGDETDLWYMDEATGTNIISYGSVANPGTAGAATGWAYETRPCKFVIEVDSTAHDGFARVISVPDNAENITFMDGNSAFYADNITLDIGGTRQLWYAPTSYIVGTNLPDRAGTSQNGTFTWGANPTGIGVTFGSMASSGQPSLGADIDQPTQDILEDVEVSDWFVDPDVGVGGSLLTNPIRPFVTLLSDNSDLTERQVWILYGLAFVLFVTVATSAVVRGHHGITGIMCGAAITGLVSLTVWPLWTLVFVAFAVVAGLVSERSPSL